MAALEANPDVLTLQDLDYLAKLVEKQIAKVEREVASRIFHDHQPNTEYWKSRRNQRTKLAIIHERLRNEINNRLEARNAEAAQRNR